MFLQFVLLLAFSSRHVDMQSRILSMDYFASRVSQSLWQILSSLRLYTLLFAQILILGRYLLTSHNISFVLIFSNWLPLILKTAYDGNKDAPDMGFVIMQSIHLGAVPLYLAYSRHNFLFLRPDRAFFWSMVAWQLF